MGRPVRRFLLILGLVLASSAVATARSASAGTVFVIDGRGWGHGVGMSQYGARGYAEAGWRHPRILAHYYRGTTLRVLPARPVRVLLGEGLGVVRISSTKPHRVIDATGKIRKLKPGTRTLAASRQLLKGLKSPLRFDPGVAPLQLDGAGYRGSLVIHRTGLGSHGRQPSPARPLPARRRALGDAGGLASARLCARRRSSRVPTRSRP